MCFSQQAAHMEELIMESRSDVISLAIPGYELRVPQCCWSSAATSVFWGRERILDVSGAVGFDFLLRNHWEAVIWFPQRERDVWGQGIVYSWGLLRNFLKVFLIFHNRKAENRANVFHSLLCGGNWCLHALGSSVPGSLLRLAIQFAFFWASVSRLAQGG